MTDTNDMNKREMTLRFLVRPGDVNFGGKVHGGAVMKWIDLAAYACSAAWSGKYCITAYAGGIRFVAPILVTIWSKSVQKLSIPDGHRCILRLMFRPAIPELRISA